MLFRLSIWPHSATAEAQDEVPSTCKYLLIRFRLVAEKENPDIILYFPGSIDSSWYVTNKTSQRRDEGSHRIGWRRTHIHWLLSLTAKWCRQGKRNANWRKCFSTLTGLACKKTVVLVQCVCFSPIYCSRAGPDDDGHNLPTYCWQVAELLLECLRKQADRSSSSDGIDSLDVSTAAGLSGLQRSKTLQLGEPSKFGLSSIQYSQ